MRSKHVIVALVIGIMIYFFILPSFLWWAKPPTASAVLPTEWRHDTDMPLEITVSSWHSNYKLIQVRFYVDVHQSQLANTTEVFYPRILLQEDRPRYVNRLTLNRLSYPRRLTAKVIVPFSTLAQEGVSGPGPLSGHLDVELVHVGQVHQYSSVAGQEGLEQGKYRFPFHIELR